MWLLGIWLFFCTHKYRSLLLIREVPFNLLNKMESMRTKVVGWLMVTRNSKINGFKRSFLSEKVDERYLQFAKGSCYSPIEFWQLPSLSMFSWNYSTFIIYIYIFHYSKLVLILEFHVTETLDIYITSHAWRCSC